MQFVEDDGGRKAAGFRGEAGDCTARAIAIATGLPYRYVYDVLNQWCAALGMRRGRRASTARTGVSFALTRRYMAGLGWEWHPTMGIGTGCKVHLRADELPGGRVIVRLSRHLAAVIDGVLHDTYDCTRDGTRCVYGYFVPGPASAVRDGVT